MEEYMSDWYKKLHGNVGVVKHISYCLQEIAISFRRTGNTIMAEELEEYSESLLLSAKTINDAVSQNISESLHRSEEMSATVLKTALAGLALGKGNKKLTKAIGDIQFES
jgi:hypothetical protein